MAPAYILLCIIVYKPISIIDNSIFMIFIHYKILIFLIDWKNGCNKYCFRIKLTKFRYY